MLRPSTLRAVGGRILPWFVALALARVAFSTPPALPSVTWDPAPFVVVASFREVPGEMADADPAPSVEVFGDGRLAVHFPRYMIRAGDWSDQLAPGEVARLLATLVAGGVLDLDPRSMRADLARVRAERRQAALRGEATVFEASDPSTTEVTLRANGRQHTIAWRGVRADAWAYPEVAALRRLERAHETLRTLTNRPHLRRVP